MGLCESCCGGGKHKYEALEPNTPPLLAHSPPQTQQPKGGVAVAAGSVPGSSAASQQQAYQQSSTNGGVRARQQQQQVAAFASGGGAGGGSTRVAAAAALASRAQGASGVANRPWGRGYGAQGAGAYSGNGGIGAAVVPPGGARPRNQYSYQNPQAFNAQYRGGARPGAGFGAGSAYGGGRAGPQGGGVPAAAFMRTAVQPAAGGGRGAGGLGAGGGAGAGAMGAMGDAQLGAGGFNAKYEVKEVLGVGSTSTCYRCVDRTSGERYACKVIDKRVVEQKFKGLLEQFHNEISVLRQLRHPHIIFLRDAFESDVRIHMVLELMEGGELFDFVVNRGTLSEAEASRMLRGVASALAYMHALNIIHRDLKPENLLINRGADTVKIIDFGLCKALEDNAQAKSFLGTRGYLAPEMLQRESYSKAVDVWALGVICFVLLCGCLPFDDDSARINRKSALAKFVLRFPKWAQNLSPQAKNLLGGLLDVNPATRLTAQGALDHPWMSGTAAGATNMLESPKALRQQLPRIRSPQAQAMRYAAAGASQLDTGIGGGFAAAAAAALSSSGRGGSGAGMPPPPAAPAPTNQREADFHAQQQDYLHGGGGSGGRQRKNSI